MQRARAVIIKEGKVLLIKRTKPNEAYWVFPGGGVEMEESREAAVVREVFEETGLKVSPQKIFFERDFMFPELNAPEQHETYFLCEVTGGELGKGDGPEYQGGANYEGIHMPEWISLDSLPGLKVYPVEVRDYVAKAMSKD